MFLPVSVWTFAESSHKQRENIHCQKLSSPIKFEKKTVSFVF